MDYQRIYDQIIERSKLSDRKKIKGGQYFEEHHVLPKCLGGDNSKVNRVLLTAREHFICHKLLVKIYPDVPKLVFSLFCMVIQKTKTQNRDYTVSSREYSNLKEDYSSSISEMHKDGTINYKKENHPRWKKIPSKEQRLKQGKSLKGVMAGDKNPMYDVHRFGEDAPMWNKKHSQESIAIMKIVHKKENLSEETLKKMHECQLGEKSVNWNKRGEGTPAWGYIHTKEDLEKMSKCWEIRPFIQCPHCPVKSKSASNMKRYHFDNCKSKDNKEIIIKVIKCKPTPTNKNKSIKPIKEKLVKPIKENKIPIIKLKLKPPKFKGIRIKVNLKVTQIVNLKLL